MRIIKLLRTLRPIYSKTRLFKRYSAKRRIDDILDNLLSPDIISKCEKDEEYKSRTVAEMCKNKAPFALSAENRAKQYLSDPDVFGSRNDKDRLYDDMLFCHLAYGFTPSEYVYFHLENKTPEERKRFLPHEVRRIYSFCMNDADDMKIFADKTKTYARFSSYFKRDALVVEKAADFANFQAFVSKHSRFVKKNANMAGGNGITLIDTNSYRDGLQQLFNSIIEEGKCLLEELVVQLPEMAAPNPSSVNTVRCFTLNTKHGIINRFCFVRFGRAGSFVDNATQGGILSVIDEKTGKTITDGYDEKGRHYECHPDTGIAFRGFQIPEWESLISICRELASLIPSVRYIGWDMAYTNKGWVVIEGNCMGQQVGQIATGVGTREELESYMRDMNLIVPLSKIGYNRFS